MLLTEKIQEIDHLSSGQKMIADFLLEQKDGIAGMTIKEIAHRTYTSPATLIRFAKNLGYDGFDQLKKDFLKEQEYINQHFTKIDANCPFLPNEGLLSIAGKISSLVKETVDDTLSLLTHEDLHNAVSILERSDRIHLCAISFPLLYGRDFQLKMRRVGKIVEITELVGEQLFTEPIIGSKDCAIVVSYSGETTVPRNMTTLYKKHKIPVISLTSMGSNYVREHSDVCLTITTREKLYSKIAGYSSEFSIKLLLDILYSCYFRSHYQPFLEQKTRLSKTAEHGRKSTSEILKET